MRTSIKKLGQGKYDLCFKDNQTGISLAVVMSREELMELCSQIQIETEGPYGLNLPVWWQELDNASKTLMTDMRQRLRNVKDIDGKDTPSSVPPVTSTDFILNSYERRRVIEEVKPNLTKFQEAGRQWAEDIENKVLGIDPISNPGTPKSGVVIMNLDEEDN